MLRARRIETKYLLISWKNIRHHRAHSARRVPAMLIFEASSEDSINCVTMLGFSIAAAVDVMYALTPAIARQCRSWLSRSLTIFDLPRSHTPPAAARPLTVLASASPRRDGPRAIRP